MPRALPIAALCALLIVLVAMLSAADAAAVRALVPRDPDPASTTGAAAAPTTTKRRLTTRRKTTSKRRTTSKRKTTTKKGVAFPTRPATAEKRAIAVAVVNERNYCMMFPDDPSKGIGEQEMTSHTMCTSALALYFGRPIIPAGFIISLHFAQGPGYIQLTGLFNLNTRINGKILNTEDGGGQYDSHGVPDEKYPNSLGSPHGSFCAGWQQYVHLWEADRNPRPGVGRICIRCCSGANAAALCNWHLSGNGCLAVIPGDYSG